MKMYTNGLVYLNKMAATPIYYNKNAAEGYVAPRKDHVSITCKV